MELFFEAEKDYKEKRFHSAYRGYRQCLENKKVDKKTMLTCCQKIINLKELLNISQEGSIEKLLANSFFLLEDYSQAAKHAEVVIAKQKSREIYGLLWESYFEQGNLVKAKSVAENYLLYCKKKHLCDVGLNFIKKLEEKGLLGGPCPTIGMELEIMRGNKEIVLKRLEELNQIYDEKKVSFREISYEINCYQNCINSYKKYWENESIVRNILLKYWRECLSNNEVLVTDFIERRKIMYFILVDFLLEGKEFRETLGVYAQVFKCKNLSFSMNEYKNKKDSSENKKDFFEENINLPLEKNIEETGLSSVLEKIRSHNIFSGKREDNGMEIFFEGLSDDFLTQNANDLLVCLIEMELYESALNFINKMRDKIKQENMKYQIGIAYMEIIALKKLGKEYEAIDYINDAMDRLPLTKEERDTLLKEKNLLVERINLAKETV